MNDIHKDHKEVLLSIGKILHQKDISILDGITILMNMTIGAMHSYEITKSEALRIFADSLKIIYEELDKETNYED